MLSVAPIVNLGREERSRGEERERKLGRFADSLYVMGGHP